MRSLPLLSALSITSILLAASTARAEDYAWHGDGCPSGCSGDWMDAKAWIPEGVPGPDDTASIAGSKDNAIEVTVAGQQVKKLTLSAYSAITGGTVTITAGSFLWKGGDISGTVTIDAASTGELSATSHIGGTLNNAGTFTWSGGILQGDGDAVINNTGTWNTATDDGFGYLAGKNGADFVNTGTFVYQKGGTLVSAGDTWGFHTTGVVQNLGGVIELRQGGNNHHIIGEGARFQGPGVTRFTEPPVEAGGSASASIVEIQGKFTIEAGATVQLGHNSLLEGQGSVSGAGTLQWSAGALVPLADKDTFTINADGNLLIDGDEEKSLGGTLINQGSVTWTGTGPIGGSGGALISNEKTWTIQSDAAFAYSSQGGPNSAIFANKGLLVKTGGTGSTVLRDAWGLDNSGTVEVQTGLVELTRAGNEQHTLEDGSHIKGAGKVVVHSDNPGSFAFAVLAGTTTIDQGGTLELGENARLNGNGIVGGPGTFVWSGGEIAVAAMMGITFAKEGVVQISGDAQKSMGPNGDLILAGATTWSGAGGLEISTGTLTNTGTFTASAEATLDLNSSGALLVNQGTFVRSGNPGTTTSRVNLQNTGTVEIQAGTFLFNHAGYAILHQTAGTLRLSGGTLTAYETDPAKLQPLTIEGGTVEGSGTINSTLVITAGTVAPGGTAKAGALTITGDYAQSAAAELDLDLGGTTPATGHDQLAVQGDATLDGTVKIALVPGYTPKVGDSYKVITFASDKGMFAALTSPDQAKLAATYDPTDLTLGVTDITASGGAGGAAGSSAGGAAGSAQAGAAGSGNAGSGNAGSGNAGSGNAGNGNAGSDAAGSAGAASTPTDDGNSGCSVQAGARPASGAWVGLLLGLLGLRRRRQH
jgi:MYXO-CTERM domain-containing protein